LLDSPHKLVRGFNAEASQHKPLLLLLPSECIFSCSRGPFDILPRALSANSEGRHLGLDGSSWRSCTTSLVVLLHLGFRALSEARGNLGRQSQTFLRSVGLARGTEFPQDSQGVYF
jgi:hypothetical protein